MRSPTAALLWEIWSRHSRTVTMAVSLTVAGRILHLSERHIRPEAGSAEPAPLITLLGMLSFLLVFGIFNYTESTGARGLGGFPRRLLLLPVSSLRLIAVPMLTGIAAIEVLYLAWMELLSRGGATSSLFIGSLLAAFMVFYQAALWTLERIGVLRLVLVGAIAMILFGVALLPSFPPAPPPSWRSEAALAAMVMALACAVFFVAWNHVRILRAGGRASAPSLESLLGRAAELLPRRKTAFASPEAALFWFEWRSSAMVLPALVGSVLVVIIAPLSWALRHDGDTLRLMLATMMTPIILAVPVGMAFSKPTFWSDDLSIPAFVAVRPVSADALVAAKLRAAAVSVALSWVAVLSFLAVWLATWANLDALSWLAIRVWAFHEHSVSAVYGAGALMVASGMFLTWRFLVSRLWSGLYGSRTLFVASVVSVVVVALAGFAFDASKLPGWLLERPERLTTAVWIAAAALVAKCWLAAYTWRHAAPGYVRQYLVVWLTGTISLCTLALLLWGVMRIYMALDIYRLQSLMILLALLAVPLARPGFAPACLARNRHR